MTVGRTTITGTLLTTTSFFTPSTVVSVSTWTVSNSFLALAGALLFYPALGAPALGAHPQVGQQQPQSFFPAQAHAASKQLHAPLAATAPAAGTLARGLASNFLPAGVRLLGTRTVTRAFFDVHVGVATGVRVVVVSSTLRSTVCGTILTFVTFRSRVSYWVTNVLKGSDTILLTGLRTIVSNGTIVATIFTPGTVRVLVRLTILVPCLIDGTS